jgi:hypothetical protein
MFSIASKGTGTPHLVGITILAIFLSLFFGLIASLGSNVIIFLFVGLLCGLFLVAKPTMLLWISLIWTLVIAGLMGYFGEVSRAIWPVYAAAAAFWMVAGISAFSTKRIVRVRESSRLPGYLITLIIFYVLSLANSLYQFDGVSQLLAGVKNYLLFFGLTLALVSSAYSTKALHQIAIGILIIGLIQLPVTLYQYFFIRSKRIETGGRTIGDSLVEASDSVVGTMSGSMTGGGLDDALALLVCIVLTGILAAWRGGLLRTSYMALLSVMVIIPVLFSENKIIVVYFPVVFLVVGWDYIRSRPHAMVLAGLAMPLLLFGVLVGHYHLHWSSQYDDLETAVEKNFLYSFEEKSSEDRARLGNMTRREAVEFWWESHTVFHPDTLFLGHGLGSSRLYSTVVSSKTVREYGGRDLAKTGLSQLLWETGLIGTLLFFWALLAAAQHARKIAQTVESMDRVMLRTIQAGLLMMAISLLYKGSLLNAAQMGFLLFFMFGMVAYYGQAMKNDLLNSGQVKIR